MSEINKNIETRIYKFEKEYSARALEDNGIRYIEGYASIFNQRSKLILENGIFFYEIIDRNAFDNVLQYINLDVIFTFNHNNSNLVGRTRSKTVTLSTDDYGLKYTLIVPNTTLGNDLYELIKRGDLYENSFAFIVDKEDWSTDENGDNIRTVLNIASLVDISVVTYGAYANTTVAARSYEEFKEKKEEVENTEKNKNQRYIDKSDDYYSDYLTVIKLKII